jgi:hypothetical protein
MSEKGSAVEGYEDMFERLYRDHGAETPVSELADGRLRTYFADFKSYRVVGEKAARKAKAEGKDVRRVEITRCGRRLLVVLLHRHATWRHAVRHTERRSHRIVRAGPQAVSAPARIWTGPRGPQR